MSTPTGGEWEDRHDAVRRSNIRQAHHERVQVRPPRTLPPPTRTIPHLAPPEMVACPIARQVRVCHGGVGESESWAELSERGGTGGEPYDRALRAVQPSAGKHTHLARGQMSETQAAAPHQLRGHLPVRIARGMRAAPALPCPRAPALPCPTPPSAPSSRGARAGL